MDPLTAIAERRIQEAIERGEFDAGRIPADEIARMRDEARTTGRSLQSIGWRIGY